MRLKLEVLIFLQCYFIYLDRTCFEPLEKFLCGMYVKFGRYAQHYRKSLYFIFLICQAANATKTKWNGNA